MGHIHSVYDTDAHFKINPITRKMSAEGNSKVSLVQFDHNSERFTFEIPKLIEGHDMSTCNKVEVHFINISKNKKNQSTGVYIVDDMQVSEENEDIVIFSWLISRAATMYEGNLNFIVRLICQTDEVIDYAWNSEIYAGISVSTGINCSDSILEDYIDVLEAWKQTITEIQPEKIQEAVKSYLEKNPVTVEEKDPTVPQWAKQPQKPSYTASEVGALPKGTKIPTELSDLQQDETHRVVTDVEKNTWNRKSEFSGNYEDLVGKPNIPTVPSKLPNPYKLTFSGAVTAEYDGTKEVIVNIPQGGDSGSDFSGSYNDLTDKPVIPSKLSELAEDAENRTVSDSEKEKWNAKSEFNGDYNSLTNKPVIPTSLSTLKNDAGFVNEAGVKSEISKHNTEAESHNDIRLLIAGLTDRLNVLMDSNDQSLDQLSEIVAYIKSNKTLIDSVTTSKVGISDIINNLTTNVSNKPLSAAQGVVLKALIDAIVVPTLLSQLQEDETHRTVTDTEKSTWNNKSNFSGNYDDLTGKPTLVTESRVIELINQNIPDYAEGVRY